MGDLLSGRKRVNAGTIVNEVIANISNNVIIWFITLLSDIAVYHEIK